MIRALTILIFGSILGAALLAPGAYELTRMILPQADWPFSRVFNRVAMVMVLALLILYRRSYPWRELKTSFSSGSLKGKLRSLSLGLLYGGLTGGGLLIYFIYIDLLRWSGRPDLIYKLLSALLGAAVVAVIEESFFRVMLFKKLTQRTSLLWAAGISSLIYSAVHFIEPQKRYIYSGFHWLEGFKYLGAVAEKALNWTLFNPLMGLFFVGVVLCATIYRSRSIYACIGIHAAWILLLKVTTFATTVTHTEAVPFGKRFFLLSQTPTWGVLLIMIVLTLRWGKIFRTD